MNAKSKRQPRLPAWYVVVVMLTALYFGALVFYYATGAAGVSVNGTKAIEFSRGADVQLFRIDDHNAFEIGATGNISVVMYFKVTPLVMPCGCYEPGRSLLGNATMMSGDWVYSQVPLDGYAAAVNLKTGEVAIPSDAPADGKRLGADSAVYRDHHLDFDPSHALTPKLVAEHYPTLSTNRASCVTLLISGYLLVVLLGLIAPFAIWRQRAANRAERGAAPSVS